LVSEKLKVKIYYKKSKVMQARILDAYQITTKRRSKTNQDLFLLSEAAGG